MKKIEQKLDLLHQSTLPAHGRVKQGFTLIELLVSATC